MRRRGERLRYYAKAIVGSVLVVIGTVAWLLVIPTSVLVIGDRAPKHPTS